MGAHVFRNLPAILPGKGEVFMADPRLLVVDPEYNSRDMTSPETVAHIDWLADEIEDRGFDPNSPLTVKRRDQDLIVVRGHCRHAASLKVIERGVELESIPVMQRPSGMSDVDLIFDQDSSNMGLRLDPLARARLVVKAQRLGVSDEDIARRMHWKTVDSVRKHLEMLEVLPEQVKQQVSGGDISATEAVKVVRNLPKGTDPAEAARLIAANKAENKRLGVGAKRYHKVTAKTLQRDKPRAQAKPNPSTENHNEGTGTGDHDIGGDRVDRDDRLPHVATAAPFTPPFDPKIEANKIYGMAELQEKIAEITNGHARADEAVIPLPSGRIPFEAAPPPRSYDINQKFFSIICRLATIAEGFDLAALDDDHMVEIPAEVLKAADREYRAHIGDV